MFELAYDLLPESVKVARCLYDIKTGGYMLPKNGDNITLTSSHLDRYKDLYAKSQQFDCIESPVADLLISIIINARSKRILETGTSRGFSTAHLAAAALAVNKDAVVYTIDPRHIPNRMYLNSVISNSIFEITGNSLDDNVINKLGKEQFDFLFLDSFHTYFHLSLELKVFLPRLSVGGIAVLHDTFFYDPLGLLVLQLQKNSFLEVISIPSHRVTAPNINDGKSRCPGVTIIRKIAECTYEDIQFIPSNEDLKNETISIGDAKDLKISHGVVFNSGDNYNAKNIWDNERRTDSSAPLLNPRTKI